MDNIPKGFPKHVYGKVKRVAKELIKQNLIMVKPTAYGLQVSLNPRKMADVERIIRDSQQLSVSDLSLNYTFKFT